MGLGVAPRGDQTRGGGREQHLQPNRAVTQQPRSVSLAGGLILCWVLFIVLLIVGMIYVYYKIFEKTGNSGWLALLMFVPIANIAIILYLAFSDWPVLREVRDLRSRVGYGPSGYIPPAGTYAPPAPTYSQPTQPYAPSAPTAPVYAPPQAPVPPAAAPAPQAPAPATPAAPQAPPVDRFRPSRPLRRANLQRGSKRI